MKPLVASLILVLVYAVLAASRPAAAQANSAIPSAITTPDKVDSRIGPLDFKDGMPSKETLDKVYDNLDFTHAFEAFVNTMQGVNAAAIRKGFLDIGVKDNEVLVFSKLMDAKSLFLTANADTVYFVGVLDLSKGPMVLETPPKALGTLDDIVVALGHRLRRARSRPRRGRQISDPAARLRRSRCPRAASTLPAPGPPAS